MTVGLELTEVTVSEGESLQCCVEILIGTAATEHTVQLASAPMSASGCSYALSGYVYIHFHFPSLNLRPVHTSVLVKALQSHCYIITGLLSTPGLSLALFIVTSLYTCTMCIARTDRSKELRGFKQVVNNIGVQCTFN